MSLIPIYTYLEDEETYSIFIQMLVIQTIQTFFIERQLGKQIYLTELNQSLKNRIYHTRPVVP